MGGDFYRVYSAGVDEAALCSAAMGRGWANYLGWSLDRHFCLSVNIRDDNGQT